MRLKHASYKKLFTVFVTLLLSVGSRTAWAHLRPSPAEPHPTARQATVTELPNGIDVQSANLRLRIVALRDDVLRVTMAHGSTLPEDASWAVLASARLE